MDKIYKMDGQNKVNKIFWARSNLVNLVHLVNLFHLVNPVHLVHPVHPSKKPVRTMA